MNTRGTQADDKGDAVMVTAVLFLSIALSAGGALLLDYGEVVGKEEDMEHLADVEDSLIRLRTSMYTLLEAEDSDTRMINRLTLGTSGNPYLAVARSSGEFVVDPGPSSFKLELRLRGAGGDAVLNSVTGSLRYLGDNYYFHDQTYLFQGGGIVLKEYGDYAMDSYPSINVVMMDSGWGLDLSLYSITGTQRSVSGIESVTVSTTMEGFSDTVVSIPSGQVLVIRVNCPGEEAWADAFRTVLRGDGLVEDTDFTVTEPADWTSTTDWIEISMDTMDFINAYSGDMEVRI